MTAGNGQPTYLRTAEVAALFQVEPKTINRWSREGKLPFTRTLGGQYKYPAAEIQKIAASREFRPEAEP